MLIYLPDKLQAEELFTPNHRLIRLRLAPISYIRTFLYLRQTGAAGGHSSASKAVNRKGFSSLAIYLRQMDAT
jgi:hypothetical protein